MENILVIEDDPAIRQSITDLLELEGFEWHQAENGRAGLIKAKDIHPDLIICDVMMPEMDGHAVLYEIQKLPDLSLTPFIFLTALAEGKDVRAGMSLGADDYLIKPFSNDELISAIKLRLKKSKEALNKMDELRDSIAHSIPHELRTPLVSILGYSEIMIDKGKEISPDEIVEYSTFIKNAGLRLNRLFQNFIAYTKIRIHSEDESFEIMKTQQLKKQIERKIEKAAKKWKREDDVKLDIAEGFAAMSQADFELILEELLDNALKFSDRKTPVTITTFTQDEWFILNITDEGRGFTDEQIQRVGAYMQFERKKYEQQGLGLGLAIVKGLVELHGGNLTIKSKIGEGTTILVKLPTG